MAPPAAAEQSSNPRVAQPRRGSLAAQMAARMDAKAKEAEAEDKLNPFSRNFDKSATQRLKKGDEGYGVAAAGSETARRAAKAQAWVEQEIAKLVEVIGQNSEAATVFPGNAAAPVCITFGRLFDVYADISDTLVGILMRARKRGFLTFEGDMLFQGAHDKVLITVLATPTAAVAAV